MANFQPVLVTKGHQRNTTRMLCRSLRVYVTLTIASGLHSWSMMYRLTPSTKLSLPLKPLARPIWRRKKNWEVSTPETALSCQLLTSSATNGPSIVMVTNLDNMIPHPLYQGGLQYADLQGGKTPHHLLTTTKKECPGYDTKLHLMVRLQF